MRLRWALLPLPAALLVQYAAGRFPAVVERWYSRVAYPPMSEALGCVAALVPFSVAEPLLLGLLGWLCVCLARGAVLLLRRRRPLAATLKRALARALLIAGAVYGLFLVLWGLNYQRQPFATTAALDVRLAAPAELESLGARLVDEANRLRVDLPEDAAGVMRAGTGPRDVLDRAAAGLSAAAKTYPVLAGRCTRPKPAVASALLSWLGITGIYCPFTAEPNVNTDAPEPDLPFSASHEMAHARGFAREDEANYLGSLACRLHPDPDFRYSGTLAASAYVLAAIQEERPQAARALHERRSAAVLRDVSAISAWVGRHEGPLMRVSEGMNDRYLRSQGQEQGVASYGRVVDLLVAEERARAAGVLRSPK